MGTREMNSFRLELFKLELADAGALTDKFGNLVRFVQRLL